MTGILSPSLSSTGSDSVASVMHDQPVWSRPGHTVSRLAGQVDSLRGLCCSVIVNGRTRRAQPFATLRNLVPTRPHTFLQGIDTDRDSIYCFCRVTHIVVHVLSCYLYHVVWYVAGHSLVGFFHCLLFFVNKLYCLRKKLLSLHQHYPLTEIVRLMNLTHVAFQLYCM